MKFRSALIRILGVPEIEVATPTTFPEKGYALIAALILAPEKKQSRQVLASMLWEDVDQARALANLRQLLMRLKKLQPEDEPFVLAPGTMLVAGPGSERSDLAFFLEGCQATDIEKRMRALSLMRGQLLDGIDTGQDQFYLWLLSERGRIRDHFFSLAATLLEDLTRFGASKQRDIAAVAKLVIDYEPDREDSYRLVMEAYARSGHTDGIARTYETLSRVLKSEQRAPSAAVTAIHKRVLSGNALVIPHEVSARNHTVSRVGFRAPIQVDGTAASPIINAFIEDVANSLTRFRSFAVIAPHTTFAMSGEVPADRLANLDFTVRSTLLTPDHISCSVVHEASSQILWSAEYVLGGKNFHLAFRFLSKSIAATVAEVIERHSLDPSGVYTPTAYLHLLEGQRLLKNCDLPLLRRARREFRQAVDLDRGMAAPRARIAQTLQLEWLMLGGNDPYLLQRARAEAEAAIEADPASCMGHWMSAVVALYQRDYEGSALKFAEAETLAPHSADLLLQYADALAHFGEPAEGWKRFELAIDLNPMAPDIYWWAGASIAFKIGDYGKSVELCRKMSNDEPALRVLTASLALSGDLDEARNAADRLMEIYPGMTAREIVRLSPDKNSAANEEFYNGLRLAGVS